MIKKMLMITLYVAIGYQAQANYDSARTPTAKAKTTKNICMIHAGDIGKLKYKGKTYEEAFSKVTDECFQKRNDMFVKARNMQPDQDRQIRFAESCVNNIKCI